MGTNVINEKLPFRRGPGAPISVTKTFEAVEASEITGDKIEFLFRRRQVEARLNALHHALYLKKSEGVTKNCLFIDVQSNDGVSEFFCDIKKETRTAPEIENVTAPPTIKRKILRAFDVAFNPKVGVAKAMHFFYSARIFPAEFSPRRIRFELAL